MPLIGARGGLSNRGYGAFGGSTLPAGSPPVAGYHLWLDADDPTTFTYSSGTVVSQWRDKSANAFTFTNSTSSYRPSRNGTQNGRTTVVFDGINDSLLSTASNSTWKYFHDGVTGATIFIVARDSETGVAGSNLFSTRVDSITSGTGIDIKSSTSSSPYRVESAINYFNTSPSQQTYNNSSGYSLGSTNVITIVSDPANATSGSRLRSYINSGAVSDAWYSGITSIDTGDPIATLTIGGTAYAPVAFGGHIMEILTYQSVLGTTDRDNTINYLKTKWGI
jgi:hypothetical protein